MQQFSVQEYWDHLQEQTVRFRAFAPSVTSTNWQTILQECRQAFPKRLVSLVRDEYPFGHIVHLGNEPEDYLVMRFHHRSNCDDLRPHSQEVAQALAKAEFWLEDGTWDKREKLSLEELPEALEAVGLPPDGWKIF